MSNCLTKNVRRSTDPEGNHAFTWHQQLAGSGKQWTYGTCVLTDDALRAIQIWLAQPKPETPEQRAERIVAEWKTRLWIRDDQQTAFMRDEIATEIRAAVEDA